MVINAHFEPDLILRNLRNETSKSPVERLVDFKVLGYIGSISAPDEATLKEEAHVLQCTAAGHPCAVSVVTYVGFISLVLLPPWRPMSMCARWIVLAELPTPQRQDTEVRHDPALRHDSKKVTFCFTICQTGLQNLGTDQ